MALIDCGFCVRFGASRFISIYEQRRARNALAVVHHIADDDYLGFCAAPNALGRSVGAQIDSGLPTGRPIEHGIDGCWSNH